MKRTDAIYAVNAAGYRSSDGVNFEKADTKVMITPTKAVINRPGETTELWWGDSLTEQGFRAHIEPADRRLVDTVSPAAER